jgi:FixJ family two-component response regulator
MRNGSRRRTEGLSIQTLVCVVEGDPGIRDSLMILLRTLGVKVLAFESAEDLLGHLEECSPAFLITELALPGISGLELKAALDHHGMRIPILGLTENVDEGTREEAGRLGFLDLVEKPFVSRAVLQRVQEALGVSG